MGFMAYAPLGRGFLAGLFHSYNEIPPADSRLQHPRYQAENIAQNLKILAQLEAFAREKSATAAQLSLAWLMAQSSDIIPIPSSKTRRHFEENIKALELKLSQEDLVRLNDLLPPGAAAGNRTRDMHRVNI